MKKTKKLLALLLALCMVMSLFCSSVFAVGGEDEAALSDAVGEADDDVSNLDENDNLAESDGDKEDAESVVDEGDAESVVDEGDAESVVDEGDAESVVDEGDAEYVEDEEYAEYVEDEEYAEYVEDAGIMLLDLYDEDQVPAPQIYDFQLTIKCVNEERGHHQFNIPQTGETHNSPDTVTYQLKPEDTAGQANSLTSNDDGTWTLTVKVNPELKPGTVASTYLQRFNATTVYNHLALADEVSTTLRYKDGEWVADEELVVEAVCIADTKTGNADTQLGIWIRCTDDDAHGAYYQEVDRGYIVLRNPSVEVNSGENSNYLVEDYPFTTTYTLESSQQAWIVEKMYNFLLTIPHYKERLEHEHMLADSNGEPSVTYYWDKENLTWVRDGASYFTIDVEQQIDAVWVLGEDGELLKTFDKLQDGINFAQNGQTVQLWKNVTENVTSANKDITLDLNGKTVDGGKNGSVIIINGGKVTLTGDGTITGGETKAFGYGGGVTVTGGAEFVMETGTITGNVNGDPNGHNGNGGGVYVGNGSFTMNGGKISGNTAKNGGGGVYVYGYAAYNSTFTMNGGEISGNTVTAGSGGGVGATVSYKDEGYAAITINDGKIIGNAANSTGNGGGVALDTVQLLKTGEEMNRLVINGGTITDNTAANYGGGVYSCNSIAEITNAEITENTASNGGGGVYVQAGEATLQDVVITGNKATNGGGGIYAGAKDVTTVVTMTSGKLYGNTAPHASDLFCNELTVLDLPKADTMDGELNGRAITGWFWDGGGQYSWSADYCVERTLPSENVKQYLKAAYPLIHTVTFDSNGGSDVESATVKDGETATEPTTAPTRTGYTFAGWRLDGETYDFATPVTTDITLVASWTLIPTGGGGGGGGGGTVVTPGEVEIDEPDVPLAGAADLNRTDHIAYINGYADGTVRPENSITREEVATIFYRLLTEQARAIYETSENDFSDVAADRWSNTAISTLAKAGIINGYADGTFRPANSVTRAELAAMAARFDEVAEGLDNPFSDTENHWAKDLISFAASKGWVNGYEDGSFRPDAPITRAEAMKIINNVLERLVDEEGLLENVHQWPDNDASKWYYTVVLEATNAHTYERRAEDGIMENWLELNIITSAENDENSET